jgi:AdoMet-dependent heme synthase
VRVAIDSFERHPIVMWDLTRACDLHCSGCPTSADTRPGTNELSTFEAYKTVDQIAGLDPRELIMTGGDPLERPDVHQIIDYARRRGLDPALVLSPTSQLTLEAVARLRHSGLTRVVFSLDGSTAETHQAIHGVMGTFATTLRAMGWADLAGLRIEVNTLVARRNVTDLGAIADLVRSVGVARWNLHFLVPAGRSKQIEMLTAGEVERLFETIEALRAREQFAIRVVEAPHYRRFRLQRDLATKLRNADGWQDFAGYELAGSGTPNSLLDSALDGARGFLYISHAGDVRVSEFAPQSAGSVRHRSLSTIYRASDLFVALRNPENLKGKCSHCDFKHLCGGSRSRAWAMTGDLFGSDPLCAYEPDHDAGPMVIATSRKEASA